ncbi:RNA-directed DNA polymerase from transposon BS, partial [Paramuricea clavata]
MQHQYLDILVLNETRLDETISNSEISIDKYTLVRNDRTRHGGGVAMYIRNSINFNLRNDLHDEALEFLCVILDKIEFLGIENNIIGDLNCNMSASIADNNTKHLLELSESYQYTQLIKEPTRVTNSSSTLIDLFLTNEPNNFTSAGVIVL